MLVVERFVISVQMIICTGRGASPKSWFDQRQLTRVLYLTKLVLSARKTIGWMLGTAAGRFWEELIGLNP